MRKRKSARVWLRDWAQVIVFLGMAWLVLKEILKTGGR